MKKKEKKQSELNKEENIAEDNSIEIAKLLIAAGADVHAATEPDGETPIDIGRRS